MQSETRPWGYYEVITETEKYKIKKIVVNPYERLSYQAHEHRQEVWVIIQGEAKVTLEGFELNLKEEDCLTILPRQKHRIANTSGNKQLIFVEVQTGPELLESDITRFEDDYNRK